MWWIKFGILLFCVEKAANPTNVRADTDASLVDYAPALLAVQNLVSGFFKDLSNDLRSERLSTVAIVLENIGRFLHLERDGLRFVGRGRRRHYK